MKHGKHVLLHLGLLIKLCPINVEQCLFRTHLHGHSPSPLGHSNRQLRPLIPPTPPGSCRHPLVAYKHSDLYSSCHVRANGMATINFRIHSSFHWNLMRHHAFFGLSLLVHTVQCTRTGHAEYSESEIISKFVCIISLWLLTAGLCLCVVYVCMHTLRHSYKTSATA